MYSNHGVPFLVTQVLTLYDLPNVSAAERKIADLKQSKADPKGLLLLELAVAAYTIECEQRVEMIISLHPSDRSEIEREAKMRNTSPAELLIMTALKDIKSPRQ